MVTIIARLELSQMPEHVERQLWRQLRGAYTVSPADLKIVFAEGEEELLEALERAPGVRAFLEPTGQRDVSDLPLEGDLVLVLGNTDHNNLELSHPNERYRIDTPGTADLYGVTAAAIALASRGSRIAAN